MVLSGAGKCCLANAQAYERFANFAYVPMPGGAACVKNPLRMAYGVLWEFDLLEHPAAKRVLGALGEQADLCDQMIERGLNTPMTSSVGRLFDAASAILGICEHPTYESEAAVLLEAALGLVASPDGGSTDEAGVNNRYSIAITKNTATPKSTAQDTSVLLFDAAPHLQGASRRHAGGHPRSDHRPSLPQCFCGSHRERGEACVQRLRRVHGGALGRCVHEPLHNRACARGFAR